MATDIDAIVGEINAFYDFRDKSVVHVGAGGGQLIGYAREARSVLAVDPDPDAVSRLQIALGESGLENRFRVVQGEFSSVSSRADLVFFEFCLHEMDDPYEELRHALSLAGEILVLDHVPDSPWAWYACEEDKATRSWEAARRLRIAREASFTAVQRFDDYSQLHSKFQVLGEQAVARIRELSGRKNIEIDMRFAMALILRESA